jgi:hypothetical protein
MEDHEKVSETNCETIYFPPESEMVIGKTRFIVTAHYDENAESLPEKLGRLLKKEVREMIQPTIPDKPDPIT